MVAISPKYRVFAVGRGRGESMHQAKDFIDDNCSPNETMTYRKLRFFGAEAETWSEELPSYIGPPIQPARPPRLSLLTSGSGEMF